MARKKTTNNARRSTENNLTWANIPIEDETYDALDANPPSGQQITDFILDCLERGYGISVKFNPKNDAFVASIIGLGGTEAEGLACASFADDAADALLGLYAKVAVVADFDIRSYAGTGGKSRRRFR